MLCQSPESWPPVPATQIQVELLPFQGKFSVLAGRPIATLSAVRPLFVTACHAAPCDGNE